MVEKILGHARGEVKRMPDGIARLVKAQGGAVRERGPGREKPGRERERREDLGRLRSN